MTRSRQNACLVTVVGAGVLLGVSACAPMGGKTPDGGSPMPISIMEPYLAIQEALAADSTDNIKANAGKTQRHLRLQRDIPVVVTPIDDTIHDLRYLVRNLWHDR